MRQILVVLLLFLIGQCFAQENVFKYLPKNFMREPVEDGIIKERHFRLSPKSPRPSKFIEDSTSLGGYIRAIELNITHTHAIGDTLDIWVQHYQYGKKVHKHPDEYDLLIACYPDSMNNPAMLKHVLPNTVGVIAIIEWDIDNARDWIAVFPYDEMPLWAQQLVFFGFMRKYR